MFQKSKKFIPHSFPTIGKDEIHNVVALLESGQLDEGNEVTKLEEAFKTKYNVKYAVAVSSGFAAIHLSLIALGIKAGDEVIIPSYTCSALLNPILLVGAKPVVVDVDDNSFNISPAQVAEKISLNTKAIIVPHIFGFPAHIDEIVALGIPVIEDCAQAIGGIYKGKQLGQFGSLGIFSFYASKMICGGDGGMVITNDDDLYDALVNYRYYGHKKLHKYVAYNYHLTNLPALLARTQLLQLDSFIERRKVIANRYDELFYQEQSIDTDFDNKGSSCFYRYPIRINKNIEEVKKKLYALSIGCGFGVLDGMHQMEELPDTLFPNTATNLNTILSLPIYPGLADDDIEYIAAQVIAVIKQS